MAKRIYVNEKYKAAFESIQQLIDGGCFPESDYRTGGNIIFAGAYEYVLGNIVTERGGEQNSFSSEGASWFRGMRGEETENTESVWTSFIERIDRDFHRNFSVVEYAERIGDGGKESARKAVEVFADSFCKLFFPTVAGSFQLAEGNEESGIEDIYSVAVRMEISGGTGATVPILSKIYFAGFGQEIIPIAAENAKEIDKRIQKIIPGSDAPEKIELSESTILTALSSMEKLINGEIGSGNFADYMCIDEADEAAKNDMALLRDMVGRMAHDMCELECRRVDVLYITHIQSSCSVFHLIHRGQPLFKITNGISGDMTLQCLNCSQQTVLVCQNEIRYSNGEEKVCKVNPLLPDLGLTQQEVADICRYSEFNQHLRSVSCAGSANFKRHCSKLKCVCDILECSEGIACKDCPYPDVVFRDENGLPALTASMAYAADLFTMVKRKREEEVVVGRCKSCGRIFSLPALQKGKCRLCNSADDKENAESRRRYRVYGSCLPFTVRLFSLFQKKVCVEDDELILFGLGNRKYYLNKITVKERGLLRAPQKRK